jgi:hypothetical protein
LIFFSSTLLADSPSQNGVNKCIQIFALNVNGLSNKKFTPSPIIPDNLSQRYGEKDVTHFANEDIGSFLGTFRVHIRSMDAREKMSYSPDTNVVHSKLFIEALHRHQAERGLPRNFYEIFVTWALEQVRKDVSDNVNNENTLNIPQPRINVMNNIKLSFRNERKEHPETNYSLYSKHNSSIFPVKVMFDIYAKALKVYIKPIYKSSTSFSYENIYSLLKLEKVINFELFGQTFKPSFNRYVTTLDPYSKFLFKMSLFSTNDRYIELFKLLKVSDPQIFETLDRLLYEFSQSYLKDLQTLKDKQKERRLKEEVQRLELDFSQVDSSKISHSNFLQRDTLEGAKFSPKSRAAENTDHGYHENYTDRYGSRISDPDVLNELNRIYHKDDLIDGIEPVPEDLSRYDLD